MSIRDWYSNSEDSNWDVPGRDWLDDDRPDRSLDNWLDGAASGDDGEQRAARGDDGEQRAARGDNGGQRAARGDNGGQRAALGDDGEPLAVPGGGGEWRDARDRWWEWPGEWVAPRNERSRGRAASPRSSRAKIIKSRHKQNKSAQRLRGPVPVGVCSSCGGPIQEISTCRCSR